MKKPKLSKEEQFAIDDAFNPYSFEYYCGTCDNFNTDECPFKDKVADNTYWKSIGCNNFWD